MKDIKKFLQSIKPKEEYNNFLKNKKVIIVGPSKHLLNSGAGNFIDSFDVIIRTKWHKTLPLTEWKDGSYVNDIGSKTDVIYGSTSLKNLGILNEAETFFERGNLKYYMAPDNKDSDLFYSEKLDCGTVYTEYSAGEYGKEFQKRLDTNEMKYWPQTGFNAIMDAIASDAEKVFITGITMYHGGGHIFQKNKPSWHLQPIKGKHHGILELELLAESIVALKNKIKVDNVLGYILESYAKGKPTEQIINKISNQYGI